MKIRHPMRATPACTRLASGEKLQNTPFCGEWSNDALTKCFISGVEHLMYIFFHHATALDL